MGSSGHLIGSPEGWRIAPSSGVGHFPLAEPQRFGCRMIPQIEIEPRKHRARIVFHRPCGGDHAAGSRHEPRPRQSEESRAGARLPGVQRRSPSSPPKHRALAAALLQKWSGTPAVRARPPCRKRSALVPGWRWGKAHASPGGSLPVAHLSFVKSPRGVPVCLRAAAKCRLRCPKSPRSLQSHPRFPPAAAIARRTAGLRPAPASADQPGYRWDRPPPEIRPAAAGPP